MSQRKIYKGLRIFNDIKAVKNKRIVKRIGWRVLGGWFTRVMNKIFK